MDCAIYLAQSGLIVVITIAFLDSLLTRRFSDVRVIWLIGLGFFILTAIVYFAGPHIVLESVLTIMMFTTLCLCFRDFKKAFPATAFLVVSIFLVEAVVYHAISIIALSPIPASAKHSLSLYGPILSRCVSAGLLYFCSRFLKMIFGKVQIPIKHIVGVLLMSALSIGLLYTNYFMPSTDNSEFMVLVSATLILLIDYAAFLMFIAITEYYNERITSQKKLEQMDALYYQHEQLIKYIESLRTVQHNSKNLLLTLRSCLADSNIDSFICTIDAELKAISLPFVSKTGISTIDNIINFKAGEAEELHITIKVTHRIVGEVDLHWESVGMVLCTALDNAIEACTYNPSDQKVIRIDLSTQNKMFAISVKNHFQGKLRLNKGGLFASTKAKDRRGIGLSFMKHVVESNEGICNFLEKGNNFFVSILIPNRGDSSFVPKF